MFRLRLPRRSAEQHIAEAEDLVRAGIERLGAAHVAALDEQHTRSEAINALSQIIADHQKRNDELASVKENIGRRLGNLRGVLGDQ